MESKDQFKFLLNNMLNQQGRRNDLSKQRNFLIGCLNDY